MSLEEALNRNTETMEKLIAKLTAGGAATSEKPAKAAKSAPVDDDDAGEEEAAPKRGPGRPKKADKPTFDQVKAALLKVKEEKGQPAAQEIIKKQGKVPKMAEIKEAQYAAVLAACEVALQGADDDEDEAGDDDDM